MQRSSELGRQRRTLILLLNTEIFKAKWCVALDQGPVAEMLDHGQRELELEIGAFHGQPSLNELIG